MTRRAKATKPALPSEAQILEFVQSAPGPAGKREIARAFGIKGGDRIHLKHLLKQMQDDGTLARRSRKLVGRATLAAVCVLEVIGGDADGDLMAVPVEWDEKTGGKAPRVLVESREASGTRSEPPPGKGDRILAKLEPTGDPTLPYRARTLRRLNDRGNRVLGVFRIVKGHGSRIVPVEKKARSELQVLPGDENGARPGELVEAEIIRDGGRGLLSARVRERLGDMNDQRNISLIAIHHHGIPREFPARVMAEAEALKTFSTKGRADLRDVPFITVDPADARDHDDAVFAAADDAPGNPGGYKVIVAIADVAAYVQPGTALDREARIRGNSVYFPDRVVPMLPERISNDLCSLRETQDRPALACHMTFDKTGAKIAHRFERVIMRSFAKLAYEEAQAAIDGKQNARTEMLLEPVLRPLWRAYEVLLRGRTRREPLEIELPERKILLDDEGRIARIVVPERLDAHKLIEEFMIQANVSAAEELEARKSPLIYRVHEEPTQEKIRSLAEFLTTVGIGLPKGQAMRPKHFNRVLAQARDKEFQQLVNEVVLRSQAQAVYTPENKGHFGLSLLKYAHFTSPIRRYADLIVHRALISALRLGPGGLSAEDIAGLNDTSEMISGAERRAMAAERETIDRLVAAHLSGQTGAIFRGRIGGVVGAGLFVRLEETGADGFVPAATLGSDYFVFDETRHALIGERTGETFQLGDRVEVRLVEAAPVSGGLRFEMVSPGKKGKPLPRRAVRRSAKTARQRR